MKRIVNLKDFEKVKNEVRNYLSLLYGEYAAYGWREIVLNSDAVNRYTLYNVGRISFIIHIFELHGRKQKFGFEIFIREKSLDIEANFGRLNREITDGLWVHD